MFGKSGFPGGTDKFLESRPEVEERKEIERIKILKGVGMAERNVYWKKRNL